MIFKDLTECFFISNIEYKILILQRLSFFFSICRGEGDLTKWLEWSPGFRFSFLPQVAGFVNTNTLRRLWIASWSAPFLSHTLPRAVLPSFKIPWPLFWWTLCRQFCADYAQPTVSSMGCDWKIPFQVYFFQARFFSIHSFHFNEERERHRNTARNNS